MSTYNFILFFHILAMAGVMIALALEWNMLYRAVFSSDNDETFRWIDSISRVPLLLFPAFLTVIGTGIYLAARSHLLERGWIRASFLSILLIAAAGITASVGMQSLQRYARQRSGDQIRRALLSPVLIIPMRLQAALLLTITFLMVVRTDFSYSLQIVGVGAVLGVCWSVFALRTARSPHANDLL
jgi:uncharacterized membrane protein